jgi:hypothetical protein
MVGRFLFFLIMKHLKIALAWAKKILFLAFIVFTVYAVLRAPFWMAWVTFTLLALMFIGVCFAFYDMMKRGSGQARTAIFQAEDDFVYSNDTHYFIVYLQGYIATNGRQYRRGQVRRMNIAEYSKYFDDKVKRFKTEANAIKFANELTA